MPNGKERTKACSARHQHYRKLRAEQRQLQQQAQQQNIAVYMEHHRSNSPFVTSKRALSRRVPVVENLATLSKVVSRLRSSHETHDKTQTPPMDVGVVLAQCVFSASRVSLGWGHGESLEEPNVEPKCGTQMGNPKQNPQRGTRREVTIKA